MRLILNNPADVAESSIWNALTPSCPELPNDIDDFDDNEEDDDDDDDDLSPVPVKSEETYYTC